MTTMEKASLVVYQQIVDIYERSIAVAMNETELPELPDIGKRHRMAEIHDWIGNRYADQIADAILDEDVLRERP